ADRAAAIGAPLLLLKKFDDLGLDHQRLRDALAALGSSLYDEVRTAFAIGCEPVWDTPCELGADGWCRRHAAAWHAVESSLGAARLGPWEFETQRRALVHLDGPYAQSLATIPANELLLNRLRMPVVCTNAARSVPC